MSRLLPAHGMPRDDAAGAARAAARMRCAAWAGAALALAACLAGCGRAQGGGAQGSGGGGAPAGPPPAPVSVQKVTPVDVPAVYEYVGQTAGSRDVEVRARVAGILLTRSFREGGTVKKGQVLYTIDAAPFRAALARADAEVAAAQARVDQAGRTLARLKPLAEARAVSRAEHDDAASAEQIARADLKAAQARRAEAALSLGYTRVDAPLGGLIGRSQVDEGTLVAGSQMLLATITQVDPIKLRFGIADTDEMRWRGEAAAGQLRLPANGAFDVEVLFADGRVHPRKGKLVFSDTRVSGNTGTIEAEATLANPDGSLKPGQFVRVRLLGASRPNAVKVPSRAVLEGPQGKFVYVMAEGKAQPRPVVVGDQLADGWIVTKGLAAGDEVIVDGMARIFFPGAPVQLAQAAPPAASGAAAGAGAAKPAASR